MTRSYKIAVACGVLPLLAGTITFGAWLATDSDALMLVGISVILVGLGLFVAGAIALRRFVVSAKKAAVSYVRRTVIVAAILVLNFPLALAYMAIADTMVTGIFVTIANDFSGPIRNLVVTDPRGATFPVENIEPGSRHSSCFDFSGEGTVKFSMTASGLAHSGILIGYITPSMGLRAELRLTADGEVEISESLGRISLGELLQFCLP